MQNAIDYGRSRDEAVKNHERILVYDKLPVLPVWDIFQLTPFLGLLGDMCQVVLRGCKIFKPFSLYGVRL